MTLDPLEPMHVPPGAILHPALSSQASSIQKPAAIDPWPTATVADLVRVFASLIEPILGQARRSQKPAKTSVIARLLRAIHISDGNAEPRPADLVVIVKGSRMMLDIFLSMLNDGYVTEAVSNKKADFTRSAVIITSNIEHDKCASIHETIADHEERCTAFKALFEGHGFRPEILDRIPDIVYFAPLPHRVMGRIIAGKMRTLCSEYNIVLNRVDEDAVLHLLQQVTRNSGVRAMVAAMERRLGDSLVEAKQNRVLGVDFIVDTENHTIHAVAS